MVFARGTGPGSFNSLYFIHRPMKTVYLLTYCLFTSVLSALATPPETPPASSRYYEMRIYYPMPGKYDAIVDRFRQYTTKIFEKHGMQNIGYWVPTDPAKQELIYVLAYPSRAARDSSWKAFGSDPEWRAVVAKTEANGKLVERVESIFMMESDLSPKIEPHQAKTPRTFELRTYTASPDKLPNLLTRFRDHTRKLFRKHDMENVAYWLTETKNGEQPKLMYILAHPSEAEGKQHFDEFRKDKRWVKVKADSEVNGSLTTKVESLYLKPTDYSPIQ
ncbi:NIPSNAP family containing protein [Fibrella aestuarina BUZ 2]|uniref:NIPSNAP family containing protein n=2 Tax=Fibrella TaxID=861914 RepID=I0K716_9BACT|nr:NIPSNAP family containing protein [Fibrella aestuarina BUZ 2]